MGRSVAYLGLLRHRPVLVLWLSTTLSVLGDRLYQLAVMWVVYETTGSSVWMGIAAVVESLPYTVLGTVGRRFVARFASFGRLGWLDAGRAVVGCAVPLLWVPGDRGLVVLLVLVFLLGALGALFDPNLSSQVPGLVKPAEVHSATALLDLTFRITAIAGPGSVGLILLAVSEVQLFALDGATFAVSAVAMWWLRSYARRTAVAVPVAAGAEPAAATAPAALPVLRREPEVAMAIGLHGLGFYVAAVSTVGLPPLLAVELGQGAGGYGLVLAATGVGSLIGNFVIGSIRPRRWLVVYCAAWMVTGLSMVGYGAARSLPLVITVAVVSGLIAPTAAVTLRARLSQFAPPVRLRLLTVDQTVIRTAGTVGFLTLPLLVDAAPAGAFTGAGLLLLTVAVVTGFVGRRTQAARAARSAVATPVLAAEPAGVRVS